MTDRICRKLLRNCRPGSGVWHNCLRKRLTCLPRVKTKASFQMLCRTRGEPLEMMQAVQGEPRSIARMDRVQKRGSTNKPESAPQAEIRRRHAGGCSHDALGPPVSGSVENLDRE